MATAPGGTMGSTGSRVRTVPPTTSRSTGSGGVEVLFFIGERSRSSLPAAEEVLLLGRQGVDADSERLELGAGDLAVDFERQWMDAGLELAAVFGQMVDGQGLHGERQVHDLARGAVAARPVPQHPTDEQGAGPAGQTTGP